MRWRGRDRRKRQRSRALLPLTICMVMSVGLRVGEDDFALAKETANLATDLSENLAVRNSGDEIAANEPAPEMSPLTKPTSPDLRRLPTCRPPEGANELLAAIREREKDLKSRAAQIADREQMLRVATARVEEQIAALEDAERRLAETLALADQAAAKDIARLVAVYENMNPKAAAQIFETMDMNFAAGFLARMKSDSAAAILAGLTADRAYGISVIMAGRNAEVPTR